MVFEKGHPNYLLHHSEETKIKIKVRHPDFRGKNNPFYGKHHSLEVRRIMKEKRKYRIIPVIDTKLEQKLQSELLSLNISFEKHKPIYSQPDIFIRPNICIFVDGCYWHGCNTCKQGVLNKNYSVRRKIDDSINKKLYSQGYIVLRFWEHEINKDIQKCTPRILENLKSNNSTSDLFESS